MTPLRSILVADPISAPARREDLDGPTWTVRVAHASGGVEKARKAALALPLGPEEQAEVLSRVGCDLVDGGSRLDGVALLEQAHHVFSRCEQALFGLVKAALDAENGGDASRWLLKLTHIAPRESFPLVLLEAEVHALNQSLDDAWSALDRAEPLARSDADRVRVWCAQARVALDQHLPDTALSVAHKALNVAPDGNDAIAAMQQSLRSEVLPRLKDAASGKSEFTPTPTPTPARGRLTLMQIETLAKTDPVSAAEAVAVQPVSPAEKATAYFTIAHACLRSSKPTSAGRYAELAVKIDRGPANAATRVRVLTELIIAARKRGCLELERDLAVLKLGQKASDQGARVAVAEVLLKCGDVSGAKPHVEWLRAQGELQTLLRDPFRRVESAYEAAKALLRPES